MPLICPHCDAVMTLKGGIDVICDGFECQCGFEIKANSATQFKDTSQLRLPMDEDQKPEKA